MQIANLVLTQAEGDCAENRRWKEAPECELSCRLGAFSSYREIHDEQKKQPLAELLKGTLCQGLVYGKVFAGQMI